MRAFIALELPQDVKTYLSALQHKLKSAEADVKWVEPQNMHLTLKFIGEIPDAQSGEVSLLLDDIARSKEKFAVELAELGAFPRIQSPRVLWVAVEKGNEQIQAIAGELDSSLAAIDIPEETKPFSSHITIGRTRSGFRRDILVTLLKKAGEIQLETTNKDVGFTAEKITFFKSTLTPRGPIYEVVHEANFPR